MVELTPPSLPFVSPRSLFLVDWRHQLREGETAQSYHLSPSSCRPISSFSATSLSLEHKLTFASLPPVCSASIVLLSTTALGTSVRLIDSTTGHFIWETAFPHDSTSTKHPAVASLTDVAFGLDDSLFVLVDARQVLKLDGKTGQLVWNYNAEGDV